MKIPDAVFGGIKEKATRKWLIWVLLPFLALVIALVLLRKDSGTLAYGVTTVFAAGLAILGLFQQYEILAKQREILISHNIRLEQTVSAVLHPLFSELREYGLNRTHTINALLASPAFGVLGGDKLFKEFVDLVDDWLFAARSSETRNLYLHCIEEDQHRRLFGMNGIYHSKIFAPEVCLQNLSNLARLVALAGANAKNHRLNRFGIKCFCYDSMTDFRMLLAEGTDQRLAAVMAFSNWTNTLPKPGSLQREDLDSMTTFGTHPETYRKADLILDRYKGGDPILLDEGMIVRYFGLDSNLTTQFGTLVQQAQADLANRPRRVT